MSKRDEELNRLKKYAEGLGLRVSFRRHRPGNAGALWVLDENNSPELVMYEWPGQSKSRMILNFIHELAHHLAWVYKGRKLETAVIKALNMDNEQEDVPKEMRYIIYKMEKDDADYRDFIVKELDIKLPSYKIKADKAVDIWFYRQYWLTGKYPTLKAVMSKDKELRRKYAQS